MLGIDNMYGSVEKGKSDTLFLSECDALEMRTNIIDHAFIEGRKLQGKVLMTFLNGELVFSQ